MKLKLDENMPSDMKAVLRSAGHEASDVAEEGLSGADDASLARAAAEEGRVLLTFDTDFGDIRAYPLDSHGGIVVFRLEDQRWSPLKRAVEGLLNSGVLERLPGGLAVVTEHRIRLRTRHSSEPAEPGDA